MAIKTIIFILAWTLSFFSGIYVYSAIFTGNVIGTPDLIMAGCGFILSIIWLWYNSVRK